MSAGPGAQQVSFVLRFYQAGFPLDTAQPVTLILPFPAPGHPLSAEPVRPATQRSGEK